MSDASAIVRRFWVDVWTNKDVDAVAELFHPAAVENGEPVDIEGFQAAVAFYARTFPDFSATVEELIPISEDRVLSRVTFRGTHQGTWAGLPATDRAFTTIGIDIFRIRDGQIVELWHATDHLEVATQLGAKLVLREDVRASASA